ncbi:hypothetical protein [Marinobacterium sedimentorum]|uniref:hypothetical protein n=1 Tax=Marinobacterium sedimentorum TaxID=2927804 RepID=UPI0020C7458D|nr:hypothetical protein [Marinobacterium sedimentorum]MCP8685950.1 hypothetical protein [Marinobacterium sedimentorum]
MKNEVRIMQVRSPFDGFPETHQYEKDGKLTFTVKPRILTPLAAKTADLLTAASLCFWGFGLFISAEDQAINNLWGWLLYWGSLFALYPVFRWLWQSMLKTEKTLVLDADEFRVGGIFSGAGYNRKLAHSFALIRHDKTKVEQMQHEYEVRKASAQGKVIMKKPYYAESFHLIFEYMGQRNDVLDIYGHKEALAVVTRLKAIDDVLGGITQGGQGTTLEPEDQWETGPGDLDDWDDWND